MRKSGLALFLLGASLLGLAFALRAQDLPETPYDESQIVACGHPPLFLTKVLQNSIQRMRPTQKSTSPLQFGSPTRDGEIRVEQRERSKQLNFVTPTVPAVPLRC
jgi:hypothetical protein